MTLNCMTAVRYYALRGIGVNVILAIGSSHRSSTGLEARSRPIGAYALSWMPDSLNRLINPSPLPQPDGEISFIPVC